MQTSSGSTARSSCFSGLLTENDSATGSQRAYEKSADPQQRPRLAKSFPWADRAPGFLSRPWAYRHVALGSAIATRHRPSCACLRCCPWLGGRRPPERYLNALVELRSYTLAFLSLENAMSRAYPDRRPTGFGELAWASAFNEENLAELGTEYRRRSCQCSRRAVS
jgi:hypothetical protein